MREHGRAVVKEERSYGDGVRDAGMVFGFVASLVVERTAAGYAMIRWEPGVDVAYASKPNPDSPR